MRMGILAIFQELHPISIVFTLAIALLLNSILINDSLTLINKLVLCAFSVILVLAVAAFESYNPQKGVT